jgi:Fic family protein
VAASHHRLVWIHPFLDGNGRVARMMSHAYLRHIGLGSALWSVSRGLARQRARYREVLERADRPRQGDLNGRGALSEAELVQFCRFFLETCIDQVDFMSETLDPTRLLVRMERQAGIAEAEDRLPARSFALLREALMIGTFHRGQAPVITGFKERKARDVLSELLERGYLVSEGLRAPVRLGFPVEVLADWFPRLYPDDD